jgi:hypothetical protein
MEAVWKILVDEFDVWLETFTTPLTSTIMKFNGCGKYFCGLIPDVDRIFGSIGDFDNAHIRDGSVVVWVRDRYNEVAERAIAYCVDASKMGDYLRFFFFAPVEESHILDDSSFLSYKHTMRAGTYYYESYNKMGYKQKVIGDTPLSLWVVENQFNGADYNKYGKIPIAMGVGNLRGMQSMQSVRGMQSVQSVQNMRSVIEQTSPHVSDNDNTHDNANAYKIVNRGIKNNDTTYTLLPQLQPQRPQQLPTSKTKGKKIEKHTNIYTTLSHTTDAVY